MNGGGLVALVLLGFAREQTLSKSEAVSEEHEAAVSVVGVEVPCGGVAVETKFSGATFQSRWEIQRVGLAKARGGTNLVPALGAECAADWCAAWLEISKAAKVKAPKLRSDAGVLDAEAKLSAAIFNAALGRLTDFKATRLTAGLAVRLDSALAVNLNLADLSFGGFLGDAKDNAKIGARGLGDGMAFFLEDMLVPVLGAGVGATAALVFSSLAPYLAVGGAAYYAHRKGKL